jgi:hypothetical protein
LQVDDRLLNAMPDELAVAITAFEHLIGSSGRDYLGIGPVFADQHIGGSPNVTIRDHSGSFRSAAFPRLALDLIARRVGPKN